MPPGLCRIKHNRGGDGINVEARGVSQLKMTSCLKLESKFFSKLLHSRSRCAREGLLYGVLPSNDKPTKMS